MMPLLAIDQARVTFGSGPSARTAVDGVSFNLHEGEILGLVGESGSGKSALSMALMGLHAPATTQITAARWQMDGLDIPPDRPDAFAALRGRDLAMVFQDPMTALNPYHTVGRQLAEALERRGRVPRAQWLASQHRALHEVGLPTPELLVARYPHELSGGMRQRVVIAMALLAEPRLLIADEPTTALDVTVQAQILALLSQLCRERQMAMLLVTHDLNALAGIADRVAVMYAGRWLEMGRTEALFEAPLHPYTAALLHAMPELSRAPRAAPKPIPGALDPSHQAGSGCVFAPRCARATAACQKSVPVVRRAPVDWALCHHPMAASVEGAP